MKIKIILSLVFICFHTILLAQANASFSNSPFLNKSKVPALSVMDGTQSIATSYTYSGCGLNYLQVSHPLYGRSGNNFTLSVAQPAAFTVAGLPPCAAIERMFLYVGTAGNGSQINSSITNPGGGNSIFPLTLIGSGPDMNWGFAGSHTYRADVTNIFSGNGTYYISGLPTGTLTTANDVTGATLLIIYSDRTQAYTGHIVLADGCLANTSAGTASASITGFSVCGTPSLTTNFMIVNDLQQYGVSNLMLNAAVPNFTQLPASTTPWEFFNVPGSPAIAGQSSAVFGITNLADTVGVIMAGMYYQTDCMNCPLTLSLTAASTPSCLASATVNVTGGLAPYSYTWTGSSQTTAVISDLVAGTQTVYVSDLLGCLSGSATLLAANPAPAIAISSGTVCIGFDVGLFADPVASYTWSPAASIDNPNAQNVMASPLATTIYTVDYVNAQGCIGSQTTQVVVTLTQSIGATNSTLCAGQTITLSSGAYTGTYQWTGPGGFNSFLQNPSITNATNTMSGAYNHSVTSVAGCTTMAVSNVSVFGLPTISISSNAPLCSGFNLNLTGSGATFYTWQGPDNFVSFVQNPVVANAGIQASGVYTLIGSFANGCSQTTTSSILVTGLPTPVIMTTTNVCVGRSVSFSVTGGPYPTYSWAGPNGFTSSMPNPSITAISLLANGVYTLIVTDPSGCQGMATTTLVALLNPTVSATGTAVCYGAPATLTANGLGFYTWTGPNGYFTQPTVNTTTIPITTTLSTGIYTVTLTSLSNTCTAQTTVTLGTVPLPTISATGSIVCLDEPTTLTVTGAVTYVWSGPNGYTATGANPIVPVTNSLSSGIYTVVGTAANTCTQVTTTTVGTIPLPTVTATGSVVCLFEPFTLSAAGAVSYTWSGPVNYTAVGSTAYVPTVNNQTSGEYTVVGTAPNTCTNDATASLVTMPLPPIVATSTTVCLNEPALLLSSGGLADSSGYNWKGPAGFVSAKQIASVTSATSAAVSVYTVVGTAPNTCTASATASLITLPLPTVTATGTLLCYGEPYTIPANGAVYYSWTGPQNYYYFGQNAPVAVVDSLTAGVYTVVGEGANTCTQVTTATLVTMPLPTITATGTTVCIYQQSAYLLADGGIPNGYSWTGPGGYTSTAQNAFIPAANSPFAQPYTVVGTAPNTCTNDAIAILETYPLPKPYFTAPAKVCFGSSVTLQGFGAQTYTWTGPYKQFYPNRVVTFPVNNMAQAGTYTLNVIDSNGCANYTNAVLFVDPQPSGRLVSDNGNKYCSPFCATFRLESKEASPIVSTSWSLNGFENPAETFYFCASKPGVGYVTGSFTDLNGCSNTLTFAINAYATPAANFRFLPEAPRESMDQVEFTDLSAGDSLQYWNWFFINNEGFTSCNKNPTYAFENAGNYEVALVVQNQWGCVDTVVKTLKVNSDFKIYVPNVFTPNGDGLNDTFQPKGRGIQKYNFSIYNRWGRKMFETNEFEKGWDGITNGDMSENDVYIWKIQAVDRNGHRENLSGHVTLAR